MTEHDSGAGRLLSLDSHTREYVLDYRLIVVTEVTGNSGTFSPPKVSAQYSLFVDEKDQLIPDGEYTLKTSKETLRVRKAEHSWKVIMD